MPTFTVDDSGGADFTTIQAAVDASLAFGTPVTILVNPGTYNENVTISRSDLTLSSTGGRAVTTINGQVSGPENATLTVGSGFDNVVIGGAGQGFTIVGFDKGNPGIENAAVYLLGGHDNITIQGNDVQAQGDLGLLSNFGTSLTDIVVDSNIFSGQTFVGAAPASGDQFTVANVARPLVFLGTNDATQQSTLPVSNISFTNNQVTGDAGAGALGNQLVNIDAQNSLISNNVISGTTGSSAFAIRARGADIDVTNNTLDHTTGGNSAGILVDNKGVPGTYSNNVLNGGTQGELVLSMTPGNDTANGNTGNDVFIAEAGNDTYNGGGDTDTVSYADGLDGYTISTTRDGGGRVTSFNTVTDSDLSSPSPANEGSDTLTGIERLVFRNGTPGNAADDVTLDLAQPVQLFDAGDNLIGTFNAIQAAVDAASAGYIIRVAAGTYDETVTIDKSLHVLGANTEVAGTAARGAEAIVTKFVVTTPNAVEIDGFRIEHDAADGPGYKGIEVVGTSANLTIENNVFFSNEAGGGTAARAISLPVITTGHVTVEDNLITGSATTGQFSTAAWDRGIWTDGGGLELDVVNNTFVSTRTGMNVDGPLGAGSTISDNTFDTAGTGLSFFNGPALSTLDDNNFDNVVLEFNLQNVPGGVSFDAEPAVGTVTPVGNSAIDAVSVLGTITGNDTLAGTSLADILTGQGGNDTLNGRGANDVLDGGNGVDTAAYSESIELGDIAVNGSGGWTVTTDGSEGADTLTNVEIIDGAEGGRILLVGNGGFATIQDAVNAAQNGDTILLKGGAEFNEAVTVDKSVTIQSQGANATIVGGVHVLADDVSLIRLRIEDGASFTGEIAGVFVQGNDVTIHNSVFVGDNTTVGTRAIVTATGSVTGLSITNNNIQGWSTGTYLNPGAAGTLSGNFYHDNFVGLSIDDPGLVTVSGNIFENNVSEQIGAGIVDGTSNLSTQILPSNTFAGTAPEVSIYPLGGGAQTITGTAHSDLVIAAANNLTFSGGLGDDAVNGGGGNDDVTGGGGNDVIDGGADDDRAVFSGNLSDYAFERLSATEIEVRDLRGGSPDGTDIVRNVEHFDFANGTFETNTVRNFAASNNDDLIVGNDSDNHLDGLAGDDVIFGNGGNDTLVGGTGEDKMNGGAGNDDMSGGDGRDTMWGYSGNDTMDGGLSDDIMFGLDQDDLMFGGSGDDRMDGGVGNDRLFGEAGNDQLFGGLGDDRMDGGIGNDVLTGGRGRDTLVGGAGADRFDFNELADSVRGTNRDVVYFERSQGDKLDLSTIDADTDGTSGNQAFSFIGTLGFSGVDGQLRFSGGILQGDVNGDRVADFEVRIVGALTGGDIIL
jgi:hypothetical protein